MQAILSEIETSLSPEALARRLPDEAGLILLRSAGETTEQARYSFLACRPYLIFKSRGSACEVLDPETGISTVQFGNPWPILDGLLARYEMLEQVDLPFPLGGCFGFWGYDLKNFLEPKLPRRGPPRSELPDCFAGFYDSLVVFDRILGRAWIISTGLSRNGERSEGQAQAALNFWRRTVAEAEAVEGGELPWPARNRGRPQMTEGKGETTGRPSREAGPTSDMSRDDYLRAVRRAQQYIRIGHIYQVNLSHALSARCGVTGWQLYERIMAVSPAPFSGYLNAGGFQLVSASPERFLRMSGVRIETRPIKGTRPRSPDPTRDAQLSFELQTSAKETAELVMITDMLRNDLGKICEYGSVQTPELMRLERFPHVQHLVSTVQGNLRPGVNHFEAFSACFPGGSVTGAPKIRAMEIIDELEPSRRGPYTGCLGYFGFNRESQLSILIRTAIVHEALAVFQVGAGIVADSRPEEEYAETLAKAQGFLAALGFPAEVEYPAVTRRGG